MTPFEALPHTGDLAYRVTAATPEDLFAEAAQALYSTITDPATVGTEVDVEVAVASATLPELLVDFLRNCLDRFNAEGFVAQRSTVKLGQGTTRMPCEMRATLRGGAFDSSRHPFQTEVKAVTYHGATVKETTKGWEATFTLDL